MGTTRDFFVSSIGDILLPMFRRSMEDAVYETLDTRQIPTRTDFKEVRDLVNNLRGQVSGTTNGIERIMARIDQLEEKLDELEISAREAPPQPRARICKVEGCNEPHRSRGFCGRHYQQWRRGKLLGYEPD
jgi:hypothetical protein